MRRESLSAYEALGASEAEHGEWNQWREQGRPDSVFLALNLLEVT